MNIYAIYACATDEKPIVRTMADGPEEAMELVRAKRLVLPADDGNGVGGTGGGAVMDEKRIFTQRLKLLDHLNQGLPITQHTALVGYGIARLSARILDLKKAGWDIDRRLVQAQNREGKVVRVAEYRLSA